MTARAITAGELVKLRSENQFSELFLAIHKPSVIYSARVNQPIFENPTAQITYDGGSGTLASVKSGMTLYVGSSAGAYNKGMVRIRKTPSSTIFYIGETAEIDFEDDDYLTVVNEFGIWSRHVAISGTIPLMDTDVLYSDQHTDLDPVPVLGPPAVLWLTGATVNFSPSASSSWVLGSTISSYLWVATGASATANLDTATPTITYNAVGQYRVDCTVTAANGKTTTGYRMVFVYSSASMPITQFELQNCSGELESGGWQFSVKLYDQVSIADVRERALVVLFAKDHYNGVQESLGAVTGYENIIATGWIKQEDFEVSSEFSTVNFTVYGPQQWLKEIPGYPVGMEYVASGADAWTDMDDLTVDRGLWHLLHWRSTVSICMDFTLSGDTSLAPAMEAPTGSIWDQLVTMAKETILASPACNRYGQLFVKIEVPYMAEADRASLPTVMEVLSSDWRDTLNIHREPTPRVSMVETSGISFDGTTATPLFSRAPGNVLSRYGAFITNSRLLLASQSACNDLTADIYAHENNEYPNIDFSLGSNNRFIDIVPRQRLTISIGKLTIPRGIIWTNKKLLPLRISYEHDTKTGILTTNIETKAETSGEAIGVEGVTIIPPQPVEENIDPGVDPGDFPVFSPPNIWFPPILPAYPPEDPLCLERGSNLYGMFFSPTYLESKVDEEVSTVAYFPCNIRSTGNFPTIFRLDARLYKWSTVYNSYELYVGFYDWFKVEAIDSGGSVIASASGVRQLDVDTVEFIFNVISNINIAGIKITIYADNDQSGADNYRLEDRISTGSLNVKSAEGILYNSLVVDQYYAARSIGGPYNTHPGASPDMQKHSIEFNHTGNWDTSCGAMRLSSSAQWSSENRLGFAQLVKLIEVKYGLIIFKAVNSTISVRAYDIDNWDDNIGSIGYSLYNVSYSEGSRFKMEISGAGIYNICPTL